MSARLLLEYDGSSFAGWARQPGHRTIQEEVERALAVVLRSPEVRVTVAGRTDAGVHAWGQVASYAGEPAPVQALNARLPDDVTVLECAPAEHDFDARADATSRAYCYRLLARRARPALARGRVLHWPHSIDLSVLETCASALHGAHNFTAFTPTESEHVRFAREVFAAEWRSSPEVAGLIEFWIEADAFVRYMNRVLVGTMLEVAAGRRSVEQFVELLAGRPRSDAGRTAPPHGLYLAGVGYGGQRVIAR